MKQSSSSWTGTPVQMDSPESGDSNPPVLVSNLRSRKQNMTKTAQHSKRSKDLTGDGAFAGCVRQTFPSPATWWVFNHHNRNLHEWSGIRSTRMYPSDPTQKQVLVVRPRGGRSGKNWRIFVRPREVVVKIIISPKATGRRWNAKFHPFLTIRCYFITDIISHTCPLITSAI